MIKAIILDVDGVIKGSKEGINYPLPHKRVIAELLKVRKKGVPVILCTGNYINSILKIITLAYLNNPHITDRGALIVDPIDNLLIEKHSIDTEIALKIIEVLLKIDKYLEVYSEDRYFVQKNQVNDFTKKRAIILRQEPQIVESLIEAVKAYDVLKINIFVNGPEYKQYINDIFKQSSLDVEGAWTGNPAIGKKEVLNITKKGISKLYAVQLILKKLNISFDNALGVGDSLSDWEFISRCRYAAAMGNADEQLKEQIKVKGQGYYFTAPSVDDNGILDVFKYFGL